MGETVSQSEIEKLLAAIGNGDVPRTGAGAEAGSEIEAQAVAPANGGDSRRRRPASGESNRHDFPGVSLFTPGELRKLRVRHEGFINSLTARLSIHLGLETGLRMSKLETTSFHAFVDGLANPTHLTLLKLEPLLGTCLLDVPLRLALCLVDRELGGAGVWHDEPRELTKMEAGLLSLVVETILNEWCGVWRDLMELRPVLLGSESNGQFVQTCEPHTTMFVLGMELRLGETVETLQLALPYHTLEPLIAKLNAAGENRPTPAVTRLAAPGKWNPALDDMEMCVTAELHDVELTAERLGDLKPGDVIPLRSDRVNEIQICLGSTPKFIGSLGASQGRWAVQISGPLKSQI